VFPPGGSGRQTGIEIGKRELYTEGETLHKTIKRKECKKKKTKLQNKKNYKQDIKTYKSSNLKITNSNK